MKLINEYKTGRLNTRVYSSKAIKDTESAVNLIVSAAASEQFRAGYIALLDTEHSADEGNSSIQLPPDASGDEIRKAMDSSHFSRLYLSGKYKRANTGIGIDLHTFDVAVTLSARLKETADELAEQLSEMTK